MDALILTVFLLVYAGMILGGLPGFALDRTGVAILGAIALIAFERVTPEEALNAVDVPTIGLLFGLMVISAQFRLGGLYSAITRRVSGARLSPQGLLALVIFVAAALSAVLANDVVCLAMAPLLIEGCAHRAMNPRPFLLALACASNVGSAATLIGNPQNMLIGQSLQMSFSGYLLDGCPPAALGCLVVWCIVVRLYRDRWFDAPHPVEVQAPPFDIWQSLKGVLVVAVLMVLFLATQWPRDVVALAAAGLILLSRKMHSYRMLALVDWQLLVLFIGLFVVNHALAVSGMLDNATTALHQSGIDVAHPAWLFAITTVLSNLVSNVPAVMLLLPTATHPQAGAILALSSTLAGNLFIVGSIANIIVVDQAARLGVRITWREHARVGVPVTLATLALAAGWLLLRSP
jgi:Na+/H+ antiporter NhaD/arsenite permease-like protein